MAHMTTNLKTVIYSGPSLLQDFARRVSGARARARAARDSKTAARQLAEHTDAQLADIGLLRADLTPSGVDDPIDRQARAMLRVYR